MSVCFSELSRLEPSHSGRTSFQPSLQPLNSLSNPWSCPHHIKCLQLNCTYSVAINRTAQLQAFQITTFARIITSQQKWFWKIGCHAALWFLQQELWADRRHTLNELWECGLQGIMGDKGEPSLAHQQQEAETWTSRQACYSNCLEVFSKSPEDVMN